MQAWFKFIVMDDKRLTATQWYEIGNEFRKRGDFGEAINAYGKSKELDPNGPATVAIEIIQDILAYRNTDLINP